MAVICLLFYTGLYLLVTVPLYQPTKQCICIYTKLCSTCAILYYCIAGKFGEGFSLANWRFWKNYQPFCMVTQMVQKLSIFLLPQEDLKICQIFFLPLYGISQNNCSTDISHSKPLTLLLQHCPHVMSQIHMCTHICS